MERYLLLVHSADAAWGFPTMFFAILCALSGPVAQLVEQRIENPRVTGSIPVQATKFNRRITSITTAVFFCVQPFIAIPIYEDYEQSLENLKVRVYNVET